MTPPNNREPYDAEALVDVAVRVFLDRGYDRASMIDVARAAELGKSSLYHHVAGKEELLERALRRALDALFASLEAPDCTRGPAVDRLAAVIRHTVEIMCEQPAEVALLLRVRGNTETERWAADRRRDLDRIVTDLVREAMEEGDLRDDLDPALVTRLVFGMSNSVVEWYRPERRTRAGTIVDAILAIVFDGLRRRPPAGQPPPERDA
ncbi:MAG: TetR/AcrR family transcriptional regulator [Acidimicrobiia bacterium]